MVVVSRCKATRNLCSGDHFRSTEQRDMMRVGTQVPLLLLAIIALIVRQSNGFVVVAPPSSSCAAFFGRSCSFATTTASIASTGVRTVSEYTDSSRSCDVSILIHRSWERCFSMVGGRVVVCGHSEDISAVGDSSQCPSIMIGPAFGCVLKFKSRFKIVDFSKPVKPLVLWWARSLIIHSGQRNKHVPLWCNSQWKDLPGLTTFVHFREPFGPFLCDDLLILYCTVSICVFVHARPE